jgi:AcrR family transcriptional regulator
VLPVPKSRTRLDPEQRREQIVDAAARVLEGRDPNDVTFEEIADEAGVSRALVYNYFGDRWGVLAAVYGRTLQRLDCELAKAVDGPMLPGDRLRATVACYLRFARANAPAWRLLQLSGTVAHPSVQGARRARIHQLAELWGGTPEARLVAYGIVGLLEVATVDWLDTDDVGLDRATALLSDLLWSGLASLGPHGVAPCDQPAAAL